MNKRWMIGGIAALVGMLGIAVLVGAVAVSAVAGAATRGAIVSAAAPAQSEEAAADTDADTDTNTDADAEADEATTSDMTSETKHSRMATRASRVPGVAGMIHRMVGKHGAGPSTITLHHGGAFGDDGPGVLVFGVDEEGPAAAAGLARGNIILSAAGAEIDDMRDLHEAVEAAEAESLTLTVQHGDEVKDLTIDLGESEGAWDLGFSAGCGGAMAFGGAPVAVHEILGEHAIGHVMSVIEGEAAEAAGMESGDVILSLDGVELSEEQGLVDLLSERAPGDVVTLEVERGDETLSMDVTLGEHPDETGRAFLGVATGHTMSIDLEGLEGIEGLEALPLSKAFRFDAEMLEGMEMSGAIVASVDEDSPAAAAGLEAGAVVTAIDGVEVEGPEALAEAVAERAPGETVRLTLAGEEGEESRELEVVLGTHPDDAAKGWLGVSIGGHLKMMKIGPDGAEIDLEWLEDQGLDVEERELPFGGLRYFFQEREDAAPAEPADAALDTEQGA